MTLFINKRIQVLLQYYNYFTFIFGFQKLKLINGKIFNTGKFYKLFACVFMIILVYFNFRGVRYKYIKKYKHRSVPFAISVSVFYFLTITGYIIILINSLFFSQEIYEKILTTISNVYNRLNFKNDKVYYLKRNITTVHTIYFIFKIIFFIVDYISSPNSLYVIFMQLLMVGLDLETIHFAMELNIVARLFEMVNSEFKNFSTYKIDIKSGILARMWSEKKIDSIHYNKTENRLIKMLKNYDDLVNVVFHLNSRYKITVYI